MFSKVKIGAQSFLWYQNPENLREMSVLDDMTYNVKTLVSTSSITSLTSTMLNASIY